MVDKNAARAPKVKQGHDSVNNTEFTATEGAPTKPELTKPDVKPPVKPPVEPPVKPPVEPPVKPPVEPPVEPPVDPDGDTNHGGGGVKPVYNQEYIIQLFRFEDGRANDVAWRLATFLDAVQNAVTVEALEYQVHYMEDILSLLNNVPVPEFSKLVFGLVEFIDYDVINYKKESSMYASRAFKPFMGVTTPEAIFLEMLRQAAPSRTRSQVADMLARAPALRTVFPTGRGALFVEALKQQTN